MAFKCPHGIQYRSASTGKRQVKANMFVGCPVIVNVNQQADRSFLVTKTVLQHENHEVSREMFDKYAHNRRLSKDHEDAVRAFLDTDPSPAEVSLLLKDITGIDYSRRDAQNIVTRLKRTKPTESMDGWNQS